MDFFDLELKPERLQVLAVIFTAWKLRPRRVAFICVLPHHSLSSFTPRAVVIKAEYKFLYLFMLIQKERQGGVARSRQRQSAVILPCGSVAKLSDCKARMAHCIYSGFEDIRAVGGGVRSHVETVSLIAPDAVHTENTVFICSPDACGTGLVALIAPDENNIPRLSSYIFSSRIS